MMKCSWLTSGQHGGIGWHSLPPCATTRRITTNLKTKNTQNCQKIELYGSLTTKDLKKPHSSRWVRGAKWQSWGGEDVMWNREAVAKLAVPHLHVADNYQEAYCGSKQSHPQARQHSPGFQGCYSLITSGCKNQWELGWQEKLAVSRESPFKGTTQT